MSQMTYDEYLDKFEEWIEGKPQFKNMHRRLQAVSDESPRGMVLIVAAELDRLLLEAITKLLRDGKGLKSLNEDSSGPLSTFSARINLAHALNIIDDEELRQLHVIRRVRNDFAHQLDVSFDDASVQSRTRELSGRSGIDDFEQASLLLAMQIEAAIEGISTVQLPTVPRTFGPEA